MPELVLYYNIAGSTDFRSEWARIPQSKRFLFSRIYCLEMMEGTAGEELPEETWLRIFSFLSPQNTRRVCLTCKLWNTLWQDKNLWKHFHHTLLGGKPRPPLLPNAWMKSTRDNLVRFHSRNTQQEQLTFAITEGRTVIADQLLAQHPELFYVPNFHPLASAGKRKKKTWRCCSWCGGISSAIDKRTPKNDFNNLSMNNMLPAP